GTAVLDFNFRFSTASTPDDLKQRVLDILDRHQLDYDIVWTLGGEPFLTPEGELSTALTAAISHVTGRQAELSTTGGTSDGRFIARICPQVVEFGPINASIHQVNEHVDVADLEPLKDIYRGLLERVLPGRPPTGTPHARTLRRPCGAPASAARPAPLRIAHT